MAQSAAHLCAEFSGKHERATASTQQEELRIGFARRLRQASINAQRQELIRIWQDDQISDDVLHHIEEDLDYHESHLQATRARPLHDQAQAHFCQSRAGAGDAPIGDAAINAC